ncbi:hypothetical protein [Amycolatopsis anabasis]|uniref:hypothetical protein n=1 Tax=Amycolatopsis anabasis TaxID=1840409 RepID=UPI00131C2F58|nr:hypothetical protein [Amycolatopsis anabasis]
MYWPVPVSWTPADDAELAAGWRLWLELSDRTWPNATWNGTPADAVRQLRELLAACDEIESEFRAASPRKSADILRLIQSIVVTTAPAIDLWWDDPHPLDPERAALLHADLSHFADHATQLLTALATGGNWLTLHTTRHP